MPYFASKLHFCGHTNIQHPPGHTYTFCNGRCCHTAHTHLDRHHILLPKRHVGLTTAEAAAGQQVRQLQMQSNDSALQPADALFPTSLVNQHAPAARRLRQQHMRCHITVLHPPAAPSCNSNHTRAAQHTHLRCSSQMVWLARVVYGTALLPSPKPAALTMLPGMTWWFSTSSCMVWFCRNNPAPHGTHSEHMHLGLTECGLPGCHITRERLSTSPSGSIGTALRSTERIKMHATVCKMISRLRYLLTLHGRVLPTYPCPAQDTPKVYVSNSTQFQLN